MTDIDSRYIATKALTEYFVDKTTGRPITGGWVEFYKDNDRSSPKLVYQLSGSPPNYTFETLPNPVDISVGSLVNGDSPPVIITPYYFPYNEIGELELYYIKIYNEDAILQKELEAWPPDVAGNISPTDAGNVVNNQVSNSQFVDILFNEDYGITIDIPGPVSGMEVEIAPDWFLKISANDAGSVVVNRNELAGSLNIETNPPYELSILPEGGNISELKLFQRFSHNPDIWASEYLAGGVLISSSDGISHDIVMSYAPSVSASPTVIAFGNTGPSGYFYLSNTILLDPGVNTDLPSVGYVDLVLSLPVNGGVKITSVFLAGLDANNTISYDQETVNRQEDYLFHYYNPYIQAIPVPSISEGWDFKVNPAQTGSTVAVATGASRYLWDQTIGWQSANNLISAQRDAAGRLQITTATTGQFALVQYLSMQQMRLLLANGWSTLINAYTDNVDGAPGTVSFYYTTDAILPVLTTGTNQSLISTIDANGKPATFHGNWTELTNPFLGVNRFTIPYNADETTSSIALNGWEQPLFGVSSTATFVAIVVGFASLPATNIYFDSISVTPGRLAIPFAPVDAVTTLLQMQHYYERSIPPGLLFTDPSVGSIIKQQWAYYTSAGSGTDHFTVQPFSITYTLKRSTPSVTLVSTGGFAGNVLYIDSTGSQNIVVSTYFTTQTIGLQLARFIGYGEVHADTPGTGFIVQNPIISFNFCSINSRVRAGCRS